MGKIKIIFKFVSSRFGKKIKRNVLFIMLISIIVNILTIILPLLQKNIIDAIIKNNIENGLILVFLVSGLTISIIYIIESLLLENLFLSLTANSRFLKNRNGRMRVCDDEKGENWG
ncbi:hypothetical protein [Marinitoga lauensis]|uniref:hypothetical protein n=1 Tax=Marinitoga lauensis TaxID=2201189 RepID=UPI0010120038|nr:hypothetical protein [Marinitoga lauensis]